MIAFLDNTTISGDGSGAPAWEEFEFQQGYF